MLSELCDVEESAAYLGKIKPTTVRSWILQKKITYIKLGRRVFIRRQDLDNLIAKSLVPAKGDKQ